MHISLDLANELYPLQAGESFTLALARSLVPEQDAAEALAAGSAAADQEIGAVAGESKKVKRELWRTGDQGLAADYDYVMFGKVSFGLGLRMCGEVWSWERTRFGSGRIARRCCRDYVWRAMWNDSVLRYRHRQLDLCGHKYEVEKAGMEAEAHRVIWAALTE